METLYVNKSGEASLDLEKVLEKNLAYQIMGERKNLGISPADLFDEIAARAGNPFSDYQERSARKIIKEAEETGLIEKKFIDGTPRYFIKN